MKIMARGLARTIWVVDPHKFNPDGRSLLDCYEALAERYRFAKSPKHLQDFNKDNALEFTSGTFLKTKKQDLRVGLVLYNNAVVGDSFSSTENSEAFLQDVAQWAAKEFDLLIDVAVEKKAYSSNLDVQFDYDPQFINPKLRFIPAKLNTEASSIEKTVPPFGFGALTFWTENFGTPQGVNFRLERKHGTDFKDNIFFTSAPLQTEQHIALLEEIDEALKPS